MGKAVMTCFGLFGGSMILAVVAAYAIPSTREGLTPSHAIGAGGAGLALVFIAAILNWKYDHTD